MSSKAQRLTGAVAVEAYDWAGAGESNRRPAPAGAYQAIAPLLSGPPSPPPAAAASAPAPVPVVDPSVIEREAFAQGFAQGERAGAEAAAARGAQVLKRLGQTIEELKGLRADIVQRTERQVVQLAVAMARRIVHREISLDQDLLTAMARVAIDRLGEGSGATIRLHPEDYAATASRHDGAPEVGAVRVVADPLVRRGDCIVQSDFGIIDLSPDAQIRELATAMLGPESSGERLHAEASLAG